MPDQTLRDPDLEPLPDCPWCAGIYPRCGRHITAENPGLILQPEILRPTQSSVPPSDPPSDSPDPPQHPQSQ